MVISPGNDLILVRASKDKHIDIRALATDTHTSYDKWPYHIVIHNRAN